jgi:hypothetical protein
MNGKSVKGMTIRQKMKAIKKVTCNEIKAILNERKPVIVQILLQYAKAGPEIQQVIIIIDCITMVIIQSIIVVLLLSYNRFFKTNV